MAKKVNFIKWKDSGEGISKKNYIEVNIDNLIINGKLIPNSDWKDNGQDEDQNGSPPRYLLVDGKNPRIEFGAAWRKSNDYGPYYNIRIRTGGHIYFFHMKMPTSKQIQDRNNPDFVFVFTGYGESQDPKNNLPKGW